MEVNTMQNEKTLDNILSEIEEAGNDKDLSNIVIELDESDLIDNDTMKNIHQLVKNNRYQSLENKIDVLKKYLTDKSVVTKKEESVMETGTDKAIQALLSFSVDGNDKQLDQDWLCNEIVLTIKNTEYLYHEIGNNKKPIHSLVYQGLIQALENAGYVLSSRQIQAGFKKLGLDYKDVLKPAIAEIEILRNDRLTESIEEEINDVAIIYQVTTDTRNNAFRDLSELSEIDLNNYTAVGTVDLGYVNVDTEDVDSALETVFLFGHSKEYHSRYPDARSVSVSDIVQLNGKYYYCNTVGWDDITDKLLNKRTGNRNSIITEKLNTYCMAQNVKLTESMQDYQDRFSISFMAKIFAQMKKDGWDGNVDTAEQYFDNVIAQLKNGKKEIARESKEIITEDNENSEKENTEIVIDEKAIEQTPELDAEEPILDDEKTVLDYIQDRIGQQITVGELNSVLQSLFARYNQVFLLASDLYNMDLGETQELTIKDDNDTYSIKFDIIDMDGGIIEITDANIE